jgi:hypothetical protein
MRRHRLPPDWLLRRRIQPLDGRTPFLNGAFSQEQVNEVLIGHSQLCGHFLEVVDGHGVQADGDLTLELGGVGILAGLGKIVFFSHLSLQYISSSSAVAGLAEINRIIEENALGLLE